MSWSRKRGKREARKILTLLQDMAKHMRESKKEPVTPAFLETKKIPSCTIYFRVHICPYFLHCVFSFSFPSQLNTQPDSTWGRLNICALCLPNDFHLYLNCVKFLKLMLLITGISTFISLWGKNAIKHANNCTNTALLTKQVVRLKPSCWLAGSTAEPWLSHHWGTRPHLAFAKWF